jgi:hypothetical protein
VLVDAAVGADVVAAGESFSADKPVNATRGPTSGSLAFEREIGFKPFPKWFWWLNVQHK